MKMHPIAIDRALLVSRGMTPEQADRWLAETTALRQSCGCETGARFVAAALLLYPPAWYVGIRDHLHPAWLAIVVGLTAVIVAGGIGKLAGLMTARTRLRARLRNLKLRVPEGAQNG